MVQYLNLLLKVGQTATQNWSETQLISYILLVFRKFLSSKKSIFLANFGGLKTKCISYPCFC